VIAGTVNGSGSLRIEVTGTGEKTALAVAAVITLVGWFLAGQDASFVIERVVTVLVIAYPRTLGLAIPLVVAISRRSDARSGLLLRERRGLEPRSTPKSGHRE
jgi:Cu2+-exporting ATPase